jgi:sugar lactone lactonase YvrE
VPFLVDRPPGNLTITPDDRRILSLHQYFTPVRTFGEILGGGRATRVVDYPNRGEGEIPLGFFAVLGIRSDTGGVLHILDNGEQSKGPPKLVLWDSRANRLVASISLEAVSDTDSFINDLAFDYKRNKLYISDPAGGPNAALVVVDLPSGQARRVLEGDRSVVPESFTFAVEGRVPRQRLPNGEIKIVRTGVDGIGIDYDREWVYYGAIHSHTLYRIRAADLANPALSDAQLSQRVEAYAAKPPSDGIALDSAGNVYLGDLPNNAFGVITTDRQYHELGRSSEYRWVDDFEFGVDGALYFVASQIHRAPTLDAGLREPVLPWKIFRTQPLAPGRQGY